MKVRLLVFILIASAIFISSCKKDDSGNNPAGQNVTADKFYPGGTGSKFSYSDNQASGIRIMTFTNPRTFGSTSYMGQQNISYVGLDTVSTLSYFRRSESGVYFYVDTTGLMSYFPDTLRSVLALKVDNEINVFTTATDKDWTAFKMDMVYGPIVLNIMTVTASYKGNENVQLQLKSGQTTKPARNIEYTFKLTIPNLQNIQNPYISTFKANVWWAQDIGIVKVQGNGAVIGAINGTSIDLADTTRTINQSLTDYSLK